MACRQQLRAKQLKIIERVELYGRITDEASLKSRDANNLINEIDSPPIVSRIRVARADT